MEKITSLTDFEILKSHEWSDILDFFSKFKKDGLVLLANPDRPLIEVPDQNLCKFDHISSKGEIVLISYEDWDVRGYDPELYARRIDKVTMQHIMGLNLKIFYKRPINSITFIKED